MPLSSAACKRLKESLPSLDAHLELSSDWKAELFPSIRMQHRCEIRAESRTVSRTLTTHSPSVLPCMDCWKMTASPPWLRYNGRFSLRLKLNSKLAYANAVTRSNKNGLCNSKLSSWKSSPPTFTHVNQDLSLSRSKNQPYGSVSAVKISSDVVRGSGRDKRWWINLTSNSNVINAEWYELPLTENFRICRVDKLSCHTQSRPPD